MSHLYANVHKKKKTWQLKSFKVHDREQIPKHKNYILNLHGVATSLVTKKKKGPCFPFPFDNH
jgi:hypothetical protein